MTTKRADKRRKNRARPTPSWLMKSKDLDAMAQRRCLMILEVLSGTKPVSDAIAEAKISRGTYYQLEEKAVRAMLSALLPGATETGPNPDLTARIAGLEAQVKKLEQDKRRADRLLLLTRKVITPGPMTTGAGRQPGSKNRGSTRAGKKPSPRSTSTTDTSPSESLSTPTPAGAIGP